MSLTRWLDGWTAWRNRLLADPRFHRWAFDFPLTRPVATRNVEDLFDLVAGFVYSQTLSACVELGLLERLADGPQTVASLAEALDLPLDAADRLIGAAEALGLVQSASHGRHALGQRGAALIGNPGLVEMIAHHRHLYDDLGDSVGLLRRMGGGGRLAAYWPYATAAAPGEARDERVGDYSRLMAATNPTVAADILDAYPVRRHRRLMDVGGGDGSFLAAAGARVPGLRLMLYDLPAVTCRARARLGCAGLMDRTEIVKGDFLSDPLPPGADLITLVRILHDHDDEGALTLLRAVRAALPRDGAVLVAEPMSAGRKPDRVAGVYFAFYLLAMGRGRARTPAEIIDLLRAAGFRTARPLRTRTPTLLRAIVARP
jgi:demethylspheroidene O-methyltransferase